MTAVFLGSGKLAADNVVRLRMVIQHLAEGGTNSDGVIALCKILEKHPFGEKQQRCYRSKSIIGFFGADRKKEILASETLVKLLKRTGRINREHQVKALLDAYDKIKRGKR